MWALSFSLTIKNNEVNAENMWDADIASILMIKGYSENCQWSIGNNMTWNQDLYPTK